MSRYDEVILQLQSEFPSWEVAAIRDVLEGAHGDGDATRAVLLLWCEEDADDEVGERSSVRHHTTFVSTAQAQKPAGARKCEACGFSWLCLGRDADAVDEELKPLGIPAVGVVQPRPEYDAAMSGKFERTISAQQFLKTMMHVKHVFHERAKLAHAHVQERHQLQRCTSLVAHAGINGGEYNPPPPHNLSREESIEQGRRLLAQRLEFLKLAMLEMEDDGNCQFRALSFELCGYQTKHEEIRRIAVSHMKSNSDDFNVFFEGNEYENYLRKMARVKTWGDELTLRAVSDALKVKIHVLSSTQENWYMCYEPMGVQPVRDLFLTYISPIHYNIVRPKR